MKKTPRGEVNSFEINQGKRRNSLQGRAEEEKHRAPQQQQIQTVHARFSHAVLTPVFSPFFVDAEPCARRI